MLVRTVLLALLLTTGAAGATASQPAGALDRARGGTSASEADVAYVSAGSSITLARLDGSERRRVAPPPAKSSTLTSPVWSPDGSRLAFVRYRGRQGALLVVNRDGSGLRRLLVVRGPADVPGNPMVPVAPAWSPDGSRLAFAYGSLYVVDAHGGKQRLLAASASGPRWSADGKSLLYLARAEVYSEVAHAIFRIAADRSQRGQLAEGVIADATWSPDGRLIAYTSACRNIISSDWECRRVGVMRSDGSGKRPLAGARAIFNLTLAWLSGGRQLLSWDGNLGPMATDVASGGARSLKLTGAYRLAGVSADGERIAYVGGRGRVAIASISRGVLAQAKKRLPDWDTEVAVYLP